MRAGVDTVPPEGFARTLQPPDRGLAAALRHQHGGISIAVRCVR
jgi:hypothetical protein